MNQEMNNIYLDRIKVYITFKIVIDNYITKYK